MSDTIGPGDAPVIAEIVAGVPSVLGLATGAGTPATYLPGRRVAGVRVRNNDIAVHVVVGIDAVYVPAVADHVRTAVLDRFPLASRVDVYVDDIAASAPPAAADMISPAPPTAAAVRPAPSAAHIPITERER